MIYCQKALKAVNEIIEKYPNGITDINSISEESRAWFEKKVQQIRECVKSIKFPTKPSWWEILRINRNKSSHQT